MVEKIINIALGAGEIIMNVKKKGFKTKTKSNEFDFVTEADEKADTYIRKELKKLFPEDLILSEESNNIPKNFNENVWMVDPLDGTKNFVNGGNDFSVMIGLCKKGKPILGVVYAPEKNLLYYAEKGKGAFTKQKENISCLSVNNISQIEKSKIIIRFTHGEKRDTDAMIQDIPSLGKIPISSIGIVLGMIAEKKAEFHISTNKRISKWDTCAPQIILEEAGGILTDWKGSKPDYTQENSNWEKLFIASNKVIHKKVIEYIRNYYK
ncbi:3'(2'),5'-bisphosphate nucleotidase CysQ [Candidatus Gracilibacteria bacterium]|nr:3'(2'),5'-bisphosphate nucleotidase CysQ [Candidatus Gracilibacteria bacterium]NUJ99064.1 3'(2'),5'-bisphosphate nucleotidase CysQ [Candidatus Gracilibacteria bacterium]